MICSLICLLFGRAMSDQFATFRLDLLKFAVLPNKLTIFPASVAIASRYPVEFFL